MSFKNKSLKRIIYDSATIVMYNDPVGGFEWQNRVQRTMPNFNANFGLYDRSFYSVMIYDSGSNLIKKADDISMPVSMNALASQVQSMVASIGGYYTEYAMVQIYDLVDYSVPKIEKIYGYNTGMYFIKGRRNARSRGTITAQQWNRWNNIFPFITAAYTYVFGVAPNPAPTDLNSGWGVVWTGSNPRKQFGSPKAGTSVMVGGRSEKMYCDGTGYYSALGDGEYVLGDPVIASFMDHNDWRFHAYYDRNVSEYSYWCLTQLLIYPVTKVGDTTHRALYIKPVGIDNILIDYFDSSMYRLESIGTRKDKSPQIIKHPVVGSIKMSRNAYRVDRQQWNRSTREMLSVGCTPPYTIKFWLRDLRTNRVGPFSSGTIVPIMNTRFKRVHYMVK